MNQKKKYHPWDLKMVALTPNSRLWFVSEKLFWSLLNLLDSVTRNFTIVTNPKPIPVNNDCARHKGLCGSGKGDLFHCKRPLFISKRKQASLIYMRKSEPTLSSPGITAHTSSERLTAFFEIRCPYFIFRATLLVSQIAAAISSLTLGTCCNGWEKSVL